MTIVKGAFLSRRPSYIYLTDDSTDPDHMWAPDGEFKTFPWIDVSEANNLGLFMFLSPSTLGADCTGAIELDFGVQSQYRNASPNAGPFVYSATSFPPFVMLGTTFAGNLFNRVTPNTALEFLDYAIPSFELVRVRVRRDSGHGTLQVNLIQKNLG